MITSSWYLCLNVDNISKISRAAKVNFKRSFRSDLVRSLLFELLIAEGACVWFLKAYEILMTDH